MIRYRWFPKLTKEPRLLWRRHITTLTLSVLPQDVWGRLKCDLNSKHPSAWQNAKHNYQWDHSNLTALYLEKGTCWQPQTGSDRTHTWLILSLKATLRCKRLSKLSHVRAPVPSSCFLYRPGRELSTSEDRRHLTAVFGWRPLWIRLPAL